MNNDNESGPIANDSRPRRPSVGAFSGFFRSNSTAGQQGTPVFPSPINTANTGRRMSITASLGLTGTSPSQPSPFFNHQRRASVSTAGSDSLNESAIDEEDGPPVGSTPTTPFGRRMSLGGQSFYNARAAAGTGSNGRHPSSTLANSHKPLSTIPSSPERPKAELSSSARKSPPPPSLLSHHSTISKSQASKHTKSRPSSDFSSYRPAEGLNWSEQFRSRAESNMSRPSFSSTGGGANKSTTSTTTHHQRAQSIAEMPPQALPAAAAAVRRESAVLKKKPDETGERILRGQFYMD